MASFAAACRLSSRLAARQLRQETAARGNGLSHSDFELLLTLRFRL
jgi:hypothetical protein